MIIIYLITPMYTINLKYRAELLTDVNKVNTSFDRMTSRYGFMYEIHIVPNNTIKQDVDVSITLAVYTHRGYRRGFKKLSILVNKYMNAIRETQICHIIFKSINFSDMYTGKLKEDGHFIYGIHPYIWGIEERMSRCIDK